MVPELQSTALRVLHVYSGNLHGGIETFLCALAEEREKCPLMLPEFALCFEGRLAHEIRAAGAPLHILGGVRLSRPWSVLKAQRALAKVIRSRRPDVVVCHAAWPYAIFARVVRAGKTRLVFYRHDIGGPRDLINLLAGRTSPDVVIANSNYTEKHSHPKFNAVETHVVYPVIKPSEPAGNERARVRTELGAREGDVVILQASRMQPWKGQALLIDAVAQLPRTLPWKCWFAGDAQRDFEKAYVSKLRVSVKNHGITDRVAFLGQRNDVSALMQGADIFCQANLSPEPFGIVFVEALSAGLPVVTTEVAGGALEILGESSSKVSATASIHLAENIRELLESKSLRSDLASQATKCARAFTDSPRRLEDLLGAIQLPGSPARLTETGA
jgi:glycosyltransferase involved in cell wall biosynthesis